MSRGADGKLFVEISLEELSDGLTHQKPQQPRGKTRRPSHQSFSSVSSPSVMRRRALID